MQSRVITFGLDPVNLFGSDEKHAPGGLDDQAGKWLGRGLPGRTLPCPRFRPALMIFEQRKHPLAELAELPLFELRPRPLQRFFKAFVVKWFEQVIERVEFKRPYRILVVGRHKDDDRQLIGGKPFERPEAVEVGHLDGEKDEVWRAPPDRAQRLVTVRAFADDLELDSAAQQIADAPSRQNFVIDNQRAYGFHHL